MDRLNGTIKIACSACGNAQWWQGTGHVMPIPCAVFPDDHTHDDVQWRVTPENELPLAWWQSAHHGPFEFMDVSVHGED